MIVISGGQTGADQAGLKAAKQSGLNTGGWAPKGFKTNEGFNEQLLKHEYGLVEMEGDYKQRTEMNVKHSNATIRFCVDFNTPGSKCTLKAINSFRKPWIDVDLKNPRPMNEVFEFLILVQPNVLNIAGNRQFTDNIDIARLTFYYLCAVFKDYKRQYVKD